MDRQIPWADFPSQEALDESRHTELDLHPQPHLEFIGKINNASIPTRYPDDLQRMLREYPESVVRDYLRQTEEVLQWLRQHPNLQK